MRTEKNKWKKGDTAQQQKLLLVSENVLIDSLSFVNLANEKTRVTDDETVLNYGDDAHGDTSVCSFLDRLSTASHFISCLIAVICLGKGTWFELNSHQCANDSLPLSSVNRANHRTKLVYPHDDDDDVPERNEINTQAGRQARPRNPHRLWFFLADDFLRLIREHEIINKANFLEHSLVLLFVIESEKTPHDLLVSIEWRKRRRSSLFEQALRIVNKSC